jgi:hypothetical protein
MACDFSEKMETGRVRAVQARNRGHHTGKAAKGWNRKPSRDRSISDLSWHARRAMIAGGWKLDTAAALAIYTAAVFPERHYVPEFDGATEPTIETVIAAKAAADRAALLATF